MFPFIYTFKREINTDRTSEDVIYTIKKILREKNIPDLLYTQKSVYFNEGFLKARSNDDYLSLIDEGLFTYSEKDKILTYKVKLWKLSLFALLIGLFTTVCFDELFAKLLPFLGLIINHSFSYFGSQSLINEIFYQLN